MICPSNPFFSKRGEGKERERRERREKREEREEREEREKKEKERNERGASKEKQLVVSKNAVVVGTNEYPKNTYRIAHNS